MKPTETNQPKGSSTNAHWLEATFSWHRAAFVVVNALLTIANMWTGPQWWALWPLLVTGSVFLLHYLALRSLTVDEAWANRRADWVRERSYDRSHIESIVEASAAHAPDRPTARNNLQS